MNVENLPPLDDEEVAILMTLWTELNGIQVQGETNHHRKAGLGRGDLVQCLVRDQQHSGRPFKTDATLFKHLGKLKQYTDILITEKIAAHSAAGGRGGNSRDFYSLAIGNVITWPETARIVLEVWDAPGQHILKDKVVQRIEALHLKRHRDDEHLLEGAEILRDIGFATEKEYLAPYGDELRPARRLRRELPYLVAVAEFIVRAH